MNCSTYVVIAACLLVSAPAFAGSPGGYDLSTNAFQLQSEGDAAPAEGEGTASAAEGQGGGMQVSLSTRSGLAGSFVSSDPNFWGIGAMAEGMVRLDNSIGFGLRLDGQALFGINLGDDIDAGVRAIAGTLLKAEYQFFDTKVRPMVGLAGGRYAVAIAGASVGNQDQVGAIAGGGVAWGFAPQAGVDFGGFRIAVLPHLLFVGDRVDPIWTLELSWEAFRLDF